MANKEFHFTIRESTPHTLPMARLAEYLRQLAKVFGNEESVHFLRVEEGSADCAIEVDEEKEPAIVDRVRAASVGEGPKEAVDAQDRKSTRLNSSHRCISSTLSLHDALPISHVADGSIGGVSAAIGKSVRQRGERPLSTGRGRQRRLRHRG